MEILNVTYHCKPGKRSAFLQAIQSEGIDVSCRMEAGNLKYDYYLSDADPDELFLLEKWTDAKALEEHGQMEHFKQLGTLKEEYVKDVIVEKYHK